MSPKNSTNIQKLTVSGNMLGSSFYRLGLKKELNLHELSLGNNPAFMDSILRKSSTSKSSLSIICNLFINPIHLESYFLHIPRYIKVF